MMCDTLLLVLPFFPASQSWHKPSPAVDQYSPPPHSMKSATLSWLAASLPEVNLPSSHEVQVDEPSAALKEFAGTDAAAVCQRGPSTAEGANYAVHASAFLNVRVLPPIADRARWQARRVSDVTASAIAARCLARSELVLSNPARCALLLASVGRGLSREALGAGNASSSTGVLSSSTIRASGISSCAANFPSVQSAQTFVAEPEAPKNLPAPQSPHSVWPSSSLYFPAAQEMHADSAVAAAELLAFPAAQETHTSAPTRL